MVRKDIEDFMRSRNMKNIDLLQKRGDKIAIWCKLSGGFLKKYVDNCRVNRFIDYWGVRYYRKVNSGPTWIDYSFDEYKKLIKKGAD